MPFPFEKQRYKAFSICIEAIRNPRIENRELEIPEYVLEFDVCLRHGTAAAARHHDSCKTVADVFDHASQDSPPHPHVYRVGRVTLNLIMTEVKVVCKFTRTSLARMFLKGINILISDGQACPTGQCQFIEYEDLPVYCPTAPEPPVCTHPQLPS